MRWSQTLIPTRKAEPSGVPSLGHRRLIRAGLVRDLSIGHISFLPLGLRSLKKAAELLRESLDPLGFQEWLSAETVDLATIENMAKSCVRSYKQLPLSLLNFRSLSRPTGCTLCPSEDGIISHKAKVFGEVRSLFERLGISPALVQSTTGEKLALLTATGPETIIVSSKGDYFTTPDRAETAPRPWNFAGEPSAELQKIHTPGRTSVADVCAQLRISPAQILKTLVFAARSPIAINWLIAVVRGDHQVNPYKLKKIASELGVTELTIADSDEAARKFAMGYVGPDAATKLPDTVLVVDPDAAQGNRAWFAGANERDYHVANFAWFRECGDKLADPTKTAVGDIRNVVDGDPSPMNDDGVLSIASASILAASSHQLLEGTFDDEAGQKRPLWLGTYEIDLERVLTSIVEVSSDEHGIVWPAAIAPCSVLITPVKYDGPVRDAADRLYTQLCFEQIDVLLDDRDARAGAKFTDADLIGFPLRVTVGEQNVRDGKVELKRRKSGELELVGIDELVVRVTQALADL